MTDIAIRVENLGKRYCIGARQKRANTLRERLGNLAASPFDYLRSTLRGPSEEEIIWALKHVSFEVKRGEVLGIIGRNGAGKTTLLKILSRITEPTEGRAEINGRLASLLEVGTGFHPELTGRENIYLNGTILGMKRAEIDRKFDEIVDFSGVEKFIDTPVKRYSSGMYVRLAFAVAAHLEPEILLVDEVLAVGDATFQKKCLGKMGDVAREGRTVLFVSHNMGAITSLCSSAILLEAGSISEVGNVQKVTSRYILSSRSSLKEKLTDKKYIGNTNRIRFLSLKLLDSYDQSVSAIKPGQTITFEIVFDILEVNENFRIGIGIESVYDIRLFTIHHEVSIKELKKHLGPHTIKVEIDNPLRPGTYYTSIGAHSVNSAWWCAIPQAVDFTVENIGVESYNFGHFSVASELISLE